MLKYRLALVAATMLALWPSSVASAGDIAWEFWVPVKGVVDVDGPRTDGKFVLAGSAELWLLDPSGQMTEFARGAGGYHEDGGSETYLAISPAMPVEGAGCDWTADETYILRMHAPFGINRVNADGSESGSFANTPGVRILTGINFDTQGAFGNRLLVLGIRPDNKSVVFAIDCNGKAVVIKDGLPLLEGQIAVAPEGFGSFAGDLILPDETGRILALTPDRVLKVVMARPPAGVHKTIGALGFVPDGFRGRGGDMYHADHRTRGSTVPGTDTLLRIKGDQLLAAGVQDGDLLATAEVGGALVDVRCVDTCTAKRLTAPGRAHTEGHFAFALNPPREPAPSPAAVKVTRPLIPQPTLDFIGLWGLPAAVFVLLVALLAAVAVQVIRGRGA